MQETLKDAPQGRFQRWHLFISLSMVLTSGCGNKGESFSTEEAPSSQNLIQEDETSSVPAIKNPLTQEKSFVILEEQETPPTIYEMPPVSQKDAEPPQTQQPEPREDEKNSLESEQPTQQVSATKVPTLEGTDNTELSLLPPQVPHVANLHSKYDAYLKELVAKGALQGKKVALGFWGLARSVQYTHTSIEEHLYKPLEEAGVLVTKFIHTYKFEAPYSNIWALEENITLNFKDYLLLGCDHAQVADQDQIDLFLDLEAYKKNGDPWHNDWVSVRNHLRALYSLAELARMIETTGEKWDAVILARPDVTYVQPLPVHLLTDLSAHTLLIPYHDGWGGLNDRFVIGLWPAVRVYASRYWLAQSYAQTQPLHSETFLFKTLEKNTIQVQPIYFLGARTRANGTLADSSYVEKAEQWKHGSQQL